MDLGYQKTNYGEHIVLKGFRLPKNKLRGAHSSQL
jgi:hypothetical protein